MSSPDDRPTSRRPQEYGVPGPTQGQPAQGSSRRRPSYGLPGPQQGPQGQSSYGSSPQPGNGYGSPAQGGHGSPAGADGAGYGGGPSASDPFGPPATPTGRMGYAGGPGFPVHGATAPRKKRRGIIPLVIGIVLVVVGLFTTFFGAVAGVTVGAMKSGSGSFTAQPFDGDSATMDLDGYSMVMIAVPEEDAGKARCTVDSSIQGAITETDTEQDLPMPDGSTYKTTTSFITTQATTATIDCEGTDSPAYVGPIGLSLSDVGGPLIVGTVIGALPGILGVVLIIVGIVKLVRSGRE
jgi:hypothetical protein